MPNSNISTLCQIQNHGRVTCVRFSISPKGATTEEVFIGSQRVTGSLYARSGAAVKNDVIAALQTVWPLGWHRARYEMKDGWGIYEYRQMDSRGEGVYDPRLEAEDLERANRRSMGDPAMRVTPEDKGWPPHWNTPPKSVVDSILPVIYVDTSSKQGIALIAIIVYEEGRLFDARVERVDGNSCLYTEYAAFDAILCALDISLERGYESVIIRCRNKGIVDACQLDELRDSHSLKAAHEIFQERAEQLESVKLEYASREDDAGFWPAQPLMTAIRDNSHGGGICLPVRH